MRAIIYEAEPTAKRVKFHIPYAASSWRQRVKALDSIYYHPNQKLWSIVNDRDQLAALKEIFGGQYELKLRSNRKSLPTKDLSASSLGRVAALEQKLILRGYSAHTMKSYRSCFIRFLTYFESRDISALTKAEIESFVHLLITKYCISDTYQNQLINAIKFYFEKVLGKPREYYDIQRPKRAVELPNVLSMGEVRDLINSPDNLKHKAILHTMYSAGLRISEVTRLRLQDIRSDEGIIFVKAAKGKKDRQTVLSRHLLELLRLYYVKYRPAYWLFEGQSGGQYSTRSIQQVFRRAVKKSNINPWCTPHTLRHSFATHLLQNGQNLRVIQALLGHQSSKTTEIYTHVLNVNNKTVCSPLDLMMKKEKQEM